MAVTETTFTVSEIQDAFIGWARKNVSALNGVLPSQLWADFIIMLAESKRRELHYILECLEDAAKRKALMDESLESLAETIEI